MTHTGNLQTEAEPYVKNRRKNAVLVAQTRECSRWIFYLTHSHTQPFSSSVAWAPVQPSENGGSKITQVSAQACSGLWFWHVNTQLQELKLLPSAAEYSAQSWSHTERSCNLLDLWFSLSMTERPQNEPETRSLRLKALGSALPRT